MKIHAFHATQNSLFDVVLPGVTDEVVKNRLMQKEDADLYIYAHIHKPFIKYFEGKIVMSTGSVGLPFDGVRKASYAVVEKNDGNLSNSMNGFHMTTKKLLNNTKSLSIQITKC